MAIDMSRENPSLVVSPRISFSHDLCHTGGGDAAETRTETEDKRCRRRDSSLLDLANSEDFDFCSGNIEFQTSSAEELFSNGLIRTVQFQEKLVTSVSSKPRQINTNKTASSSSSSSLLPPLPTNTNGISISKQESVSSNSNSDHQQNNNKIQSKSFWRIKRCSSLHCDNKKTSFWSLPLLSRSNSTGSVQHNTNHPPKSTTKQQNGNSRQQQHSKNNNNVGGISSSSTATFYVYPLSQKPPLRRNYLGPNNGVNGVRINPVLNVPSPHISKGTANLLGLGSFFRNGKDKKIVKK